MKLSDVLSRSAVRVISKETTKDDIFHELGIIAQRVHQLKARDVYSTLLQREGENSSAVGRGVAVPHSRFPDVEKTTGLFVKLAKPVDFKSRDMLGVDLIFALLIPVDLPEVRAPKELRASRSNFARPRNPGEASLHGAALAYPHDPNRSFQAGSGVALDEIGHHEVRARGA